MHKQHRNAHKKTRGAFKKQRDLRNPRPGNESNPPDNSGMVQIPRPLFVRQAIDKRTFKVDYTLTTGTGAPIQFVASLYYPFYVSNAPGSGSAFAATAPTPLTNMYGVYGLYKVKKIQVIFSPMLTSMVIPAAFTVGMVLDATNTNAASFTPAQLIDYPNATKISPIAPAELTYNVPRISSTSVAGELVLQGGWTTSTPQPGLASNGNLVITQNSPYTVSTTYSILTLDYEIWFKNPI